MGQSPSGSPAPTLSVAEVLSKTQQWFASKGIPSPRLEAELLAAHTLGCDRMHLLAQFDRPLTAAEGDALRDLVRRRAAGEPTAYLVGHREFFGLSFRVTQDVLIPRPETEVLVETAIETLRGICVGRGGDAASGVAPDALAHMRKCASAQVRDDASGVQSTEGPPENILFADVGTGSGAIAVALTKHVPMTRGWATDLSPAALAIARENAERNGVAERITFLEGDLTAPLRSAGLEGRLDLVCANLPYVADDEAPTLPREVLGHEPRLALFSGPDGLALLRRLIADAPAFLRPGGTLLLEVGAGQAPVVLELLAATRAFATMGAIGDLTEIERVVRARRA